MLFNLPLPKDMMPRDKKLEITLKNGEFEHGYLVQKQKDYRDINPTDNEKSLLATHSSILLFRGGYYTQVEDVSSDNGDCVRTRLEYHVCGVN